MGGQFAVNLIAASLYESTLHDPSKASSIAPAALTMLFFFNLIYAALGYCRVPDPNRDSFPRRFAFRGMVSVLHDGLSELVGPSW